MDVKVRTGDGPPGVLRTLNFGDLIVICPVRAWARAGKLEVEYVVDIDESSDPPRLVCTELTLRRRPGGPPITSTAARPRVAELVQEAVRRAAHPRQVTERTPRLVGGRQVRPVTDHRRAKRGRKPTVPDDELLDFLALYRSEGLSEAMNAYFLTKSTAVRTKRRAEELERAQTSKRAPRKKKGTR